MSTGAKLENQSRVDQTGGHQMVNKGPTGQKLYQPPKFQGKSGQPDNQSTSRPQGST
jgi:hypothetical protein